MRLRGVALPRFRRVHWLGPWSFTSSLIHPMISYFYCFSICFFIKYTWHLLYWSFILLSVNLQPSEPRYFPLRDTSRALLELPLHYDQRHCKRSSGTNRHDTAQQRHGTPPFYRDVLAWPRLGSTRTTAAPRQSTTARHRRCLPRKDPTMLSSQTATLRPRRGLRPLTAMSI